MACIGWAFAEEMIAGQGEPGVRVSFLEPPDPAAGAAGAQPGSLLKQKCPIRARHSQAD